MTDPELSNSLPSKPLQKNHHFWKLRHLSTTAIHVKDLWHCWSTEANEHIGFHPNQMWTPHYACTDQWCDTKCKDWKQDCSRHLQKHQNMSGWLPISSLSCLSCLYLTFPSKPLPPVISTIGYHKPLLWSLERIIDRCIQDHYRPQVCWWNLIPRIRRVENQSSWKRDTWLAAGLHLN